MMVSRKRLLGRGIADRWVGLLRGTRVESDVAAGASNTLRPLTHSSDLTRGGGCMQPTQNGLLPSMEPDQARPYVIDMLDSLRRQREAYQVNRHRYVLLARKYGLTLADIAETLGMSESGIRYIVDMADGTPEFVEAGGGE